MNSYRLYRYELGRIAGVREFLSADDQAAIGEVTDEAASGCRMELWNLGRFVKCFADDARKDRAN